MSYQDEDYEKMFSERDEFREIEAAVQQASEKTYQNGIKKQNSITHNNSRNIPTDSVKPNIKRPNQLFKKIVAFALVAALGIPVGNKIYESIQTSPTAHSNNLIEALRKHLVDKKLGINRNHYVELTAHPSDIIKELNINENDTILIYLLDCCLDYDDFKSIIQQFGYASVDSYLKTLGYVTTDEGPATRKFSESMSEILIQRIKKDPTYLNDILEKLGISLSDFSRETEYYIAESGVIFEIADTEHDPNEVRKYK